MGEIAIMLLEGTMCTVCGCIIEDLIIPNSPKLKEPPGHPRKCETCTKREDKPRPGAWKKNRR